MEYQEYQNRIERGTQMFEAGNYAAALEIFVSLVNSDISEVDKSRMCLNVAAIYERMENTHEALQWYQRAIQLEKAHARFEAQEYLASYLIEIGRGRDALRILESLLPSSHLTEEDKVRLREKARNLRDELNKPTHRRPGAPET
ncbi:MAG: hypothetical protein JW726_06135 [Anaerolineales bacterium]|nr:hypothetical protein [Anaerolineales bacterium]